MTFLFFLLFVELGNVLYSGSVLYRQRDEFDPQREDFNIQREEFNLQRDNSISNIGNASSSRHSGHSRNSSLDLRGEYSKPSQFINTILFPLMETGIFQQFFIFSLSNMFICIRFYLCISTFTYCFIGSTTFTKFIG